MKKAFVYTAGSAVVAMATGILYARLRDLSENGDESSHIEQAGIPGQMREQDAAQLENAKMVSEGSQFGVQYYNEAKEERVRVID